MIFLSPLSPEILEACSLFSPNKIGFILSKNQADYDGGYLGTTKEIVDDIRRLRQKYLICRDHCGPGFKQIKERSHYLDCLRTIEEDDKYGFDLIHIDTCKARESKESKLTLGRELANHALELNANIKIEIGSEENTGELNHIDDILQELQFYRSWDVPITYYVTNTGSLVMENIQLGKFQIEQVKQIKEIADEFGVLLKEHNADYLSEEDIKLRNGLIGALNITPNLGYIQTLTTLLEASKYGIDSYKFQNLVFNGRKWHKWSTYGGGPGAMTLAENFFLAVCVAGHYHFRSEEYQKLLDHVEKYTDIRDIIIKNVEDVVRLYTNNFKGLN